MKFKNTIDKVFGYEFKERCPKCAAERLLLTQEDNSPEYYTRVGMFCGCGEILWFRLPVN